MTFTLLIIAVLGGVAIVTSRVARRFVPEVVVFLSLGLLIGREGPLKLINDQNIGSLTRLTEVALGVLLFLIGDRLRFDDLRTRWRALVGINVLQILLAAMLVLFATRAAGASVQVAIVLGLIAAESGVLTVSATVKEERASGPVTETLLSSLGVTNVAVALLFALTFPFILASSGAVSSPWATVLIFARLVVLSAVIGMVGGVVLRRYSPTIESSGELLLFLTVVLVGVVGAAVALEGSIVVGSLVTGLYVANTAPRVADRLFATVRTLEAPIYLVFFIVAGAGIHLERLAAVGGIGAVYVGARGLGKIVGSALGGLAGRAGLGTGLRVGFGLLPHAGMAIGLVALVVEQAPRIGGDVSAVVLGSIIVFELAGPLCTRRALRAAGEDGQARAGLGAEVVPQVLTQRTFDKVLIPVSGVAILLPRLPFLLDLIGTMGAELVAVHVSRPGVGVHGEDEPQVLRLIKQFAAERNIECATVHCVSRQVASTIVRVARAQQVDLVVLGEPVHASLRESSRWGLISQRVIRDVDMPVLVYPVDPSNPQRVPSLYLRRAERAAQAEEAPS